MFHNFEERFAKPEITVSAPREYGVTTSLLTRGGEMSRDGAGLYLPQNYTRLGRARGTVMTVTAKPQLACLETASAKSIFQQEKSTLHTAPEGYSNCGFALVAQHIATSAGFKSEIYTPSAEP